MTNPRQQEAMAVGAELLRRVQTGEVCARCHVEFDNRHGIQVLCYTCHDRGSPGLSSLPKAWHEEKAK